MARVQPRAAAARGDVSPVVHATTMTKFLSLRRARVDAGVDRPLC